MTENHTVKYPVFCPKNKADKKKSYLPYLYELCNKMHLLQTHTCSDLLFIAGFIISAEYLTL